MAEHKASRLGMDLKTQLKINDAYTRGMRLVWENPFPEDEFAAQTVVCDTAENDLVAVKYKTNSTYTGGNVFYAFGKTGDKLEMTAFAAKLRKRTVEFAIGGVIFSNGGYSTFGSETTTADNKMICPLAVYVYKDFFK